MDGNQENRLSCDQAHCALSMKTNSNHFNISSNTVTDMHVFTLLSVCLFVLSAATQMLSRTIMMHLLSICNYLRF